MTAKRSTKKTKGGSSKSSAAHRRKLFVEAYIANGCNATQAAISAGFSQKSAYSQGQRLLKHVEIQQLLRNRQNEIAQKFELTTESVIAELAKIVHCDPRRLFDAKGALLPLKDWPDEVAGAVASLEVEELFVGRGDEKVSIGATKKLKFWDKNSAIEKAMKHLGLFERDNEQKTDPLRDLLERVSGSSLKPVE